MLEAAQARGESPPPWAEDVPDLLEGEDFYLRAFWDLTSERYPTPGPVPSRIPWSAVVAYGSRFGLEPGMVDVLAEVVRELDSAYLKWEADEAEEQRRRERQRADEDG